jgi:hypothetical protein
MPFYLYRLDGDNFDRVRSNVPLAGVNGPLCGAARCTPDNPEWDLSGEALVRFFGVDSSDHAVVIDLKPRVPNEISLYRVKHLWAYSSHGWTPFALELEGLYVDAQPPAGTSAAAFKQRFPRLAQPGGRIYEFLYLNGDGKSGRWAFGRVGSVNAPLLWERVFDSLLKRINRKRRDIDRLPPLGCRDGES